MTPLARNAKEVNAIDCDADAHVTVCCGATECMIATMRALVDADE